MLPNTLTDEQINSFSTSGSTLPKTLSDSEISQFDNKQKEKSLLQKTADFGQKIADFTGISGVAKGIGEILGAPLADKVTKESTNQINDLIIQAHNTSDPNARRDLLLQAKKVADDTKKVTSDFLDNTPTQTQFVGSGLKLGSFFVPASTLVTAVTGAGLYSVGDQLETNGTINPDKLTVDVALAGLTHGLIKGSSKLFETIGNSEATNIASANFQGAKKIAGVGLSQTEKAVNQATGVSGLSFGGQLKFAGNESLQATKEVANAAIKGFKDSWTGNVLGKFSVAGGLGSAGFLYDWLINGDSITNSLGTGLKVAAGAAALSAGKEAFSVKNLQRFAAVAGTNSITVKALESAQKMLKLKEVLGNQEFEKLITRLMANKVNQYGN